MKYDVEKSHSVNSEVLIAEMSAYQEKLWERSRFCECGAESLSSCTCDPEKKARFKRRMNRKTSKKFRGRLKHLSSQNLFLSLH